MRIRLGAVLAAAACFGVLTGWQAASASVGQDGGGATFNDCWFDFSVYYNTDGVPGSPGWYAFGLTYSSCATLRIANGYYWNSSLGGFYGPHNCSGCGSGWVNIATAYAAWSIYSVAPTTNAYLYAQIRHPSTNWSPTYELQAAE